MSTRNSSESINAAGRWGWCARGTRLLESQRGKPQDSREPPMRRSWRHHSQHAPPTCAPTHPPTSPPTHPPARPPAHPPTHVAVAGAIVPQAQRVDHPLLVLGCVPVPVAGLQVSGSCLEVFNVVIRQAPGLQGKRSAGSRENRTSGRWQAAGCELFATSGAPDGSSSSTHSNIAAGP